MDFQGPTPADYENVRCLNSVFLGLLRMNRPCRRWLEGLMPEFRLRLQRLNPRETGWLSATPFLLFSFRERDDALWQQILTRSTSGDLFATPATDDAARLVAAGLGFIWQLAGRNPFAARLLCGASTHWCEQISERPFVQLLTAAAERPDLIGLRSPDDTDLWRKLLGDGLSEKADFRHAAHVSALQYILIRQPTTVTWAAAACVTRDRTLKVADERQAR